MAEREPDFTGWATKNNLECTDGRTIMTGAFKHMDKQTVPLVWMHRHTEPENVLGHALLEDRAFGTYTSAWFNQSEKAKAMKHAVDHGDVVALSIFANNLSERRVGTGREVLHGDIKEVSLVLAGANPGALIENVNIIHADSNTFEIMDDEVLIHTGLPLGYDPGPEGAAKVPEDKTDVISHEDTATDTAAADASVDTASNTDTSGVDPTDPNWVKSQFETLNENQKIAVVQMMGTLEDDLMETFGGDDTNSETDDVEHSGTTNNGENTLAHNQEGGDNMSRNVFDKTDGAPVATKTLSHSAMLNVIAAAKKAGSFRELFSENGEAELKHAAGDFGTAGTDYGVADIETLFPDHKNDGDPQVIKRDTSWVSIVLNGVKKQPFAKIKSILFDITAEEARAKGYVKATMKKDEVVKLMKRTTSPTTVYKKQRLDRDDILDITDFDIVAWLKAEIRLMLDEEIARAILVGDGRSSSNPDKILDPEGETNGIGIRSILHDHEVYAHKITLPANISAEDRIEEITRSRGKYRGSGSPTLFTTDKEITDMLLQKDKVGRRLYGTEAELASVLRVSDIVPVEVMEQYANVLAIIVNLRDYTVGANRGGEVTYFSQFDIDFNQEKYLMETRISGALNRPKSAIVIVREQGEAVVASTPQFAANKITIPTKAGVIYVIDDEPVTGQVTITEDTTVEAKADEGYYLESDSTKRWNYTYSAQ